METNNAAQAESYYRLIGEKNVVGIKGYLHPDVELYSPLAVVRGREAVIQATSQFVETFHSLEIRAKFGAVEQAMIVYEVNTPGIAKDFPGASLLNFRDGLIVRIQLFYDGSRFLEKKEEIFAQT